MYITSQRDREWYLKDIERSSLTEFREAINQIIQEEDTYIVDTIPSTKTGKSTSKPSPFYISADCSLNESSYSETIHFYGTIEVKKLNSEGEQETIMTICNTEEQDKWIQALWKLKSVYQQGYA